MLLFAMAQKTRVIHFVKDNTHHTTTPTILSKKKVGPRSFIMHETTVLSGNLLNGKVLVQCTPTTLRVLKSTPTLPTMLCEDGTCFSVFFVFFVFLSLCIDLLTDKVQPLSRSLGGTRVSGGSSGHVVAGESRYDVLLTMIYC